jgi:ectoine hydroxylase-related dioxygenase (phytanoyl-CoA dioxygenase family)
MSFAEQGFAILPSVLRSDEVEDLLLALSGLRLEPLRGGIRRIEQRLPQVATLAHSAPLRALAQAYLSGSPQLVRAIYFDKSPSNNWLVSWHQDKTVAVSARFAVEGWRAWSLKAGAWHVQPPLAILEDMLTLRIHLDPATVANGCLKVLPGSQRHGLIATAAVRHHIDDSQVVYCEVPVGGAVIMRPHLLHASEKAVAPLPRRVLHFEYSSYPLPPGVAWAA